MDAERLEAMATDAPNPKTARERLYEAFDKEPDGLVARCLALFVIFLEDPFSAEQVKELAAGLPAEQAERVWLIWEAANEVPS